MRLVRVLKVETYSFININGSPDSQAYLRDRAVGCDCLGPLLRLLRQIVFCSTISQNDILESSMQQWKKVVPPRQFPPLSHITLR